MNLASILSDCFVDRIPARCVRACVRACLCELHELGVSLERLLRRPDPCSIAQFSSGEFSSGVEGLALGFKV